jgi:hypothetical protein
MITLTCTSEPEAELYLFSIERDGEVSPRLTRTEEAIARLTMYEAENAERLVDQAAHYRVIAIHEHG